MNASLRSNLPLAEKQDYIKRGLRDVNRNDSSVGNGMLDFRVVKELGKGSYGTVYLVRSLLDHGEYVMKNISLA